MASKPLVLVLGDNHVYWLERFVTSAEVDFALGSFREGRDCRIAFKGCRDGTVTTMAKNRGLDRLLEAELPAVVVLSVAGNAIDTTASMGSLTTLEVGMQLYNFAQVLVQRGIQQVVVCQVVRRKSWRHLTQEVVTARVSEIRGLCVMTNTCLSGIIRCSGIAKKRSSVGMGSISMLGAISNYGRAFKVAVSGP